MVHIEDGEYLTVAQAAERLGYGVAWVRRACQHRRIPGAIQVGTAWLIPEGALAAWERRKPGRPKDSTKGPSG